MFHSGHWAAAFIDSLEKEGEEIKEGIDILKILGAWAKNLPGEVFGSAAAEKVEQLIREVMPKTEECAIRFLVLIIKKNKLRYLDSLIKEAEKLLDKKRGVVSASLEYAFPLDESTESRIKEGIKKRTGAAGVNMTGHLNAGLIGGYRLRIGDEIIDASVLSQLQKLQTALQSGLTTLQSGQAHGGN